MLTEKIDFLPKKYFILYQFSKQNKLAHNLFLKKNIVNIFQKCQNILVHVMSIKCK